MDTDKAFDSIRDNIKNENYSAVRPQIDSIIAANPDDINIMLKCASLLKTIDDEEGCQSILDDVVDIAPESDFDTAMALRGLGRAEDAYELMRSYRGERDKDPEIARTLMMIDESEEALEIAKGLNYPSTEERILLCDILCSLGEFTDALKEAQEILDGDESYQSLVNICTVLMKMGRVKDAVKIAKEHVKEDKKNPDSLALAAYVMYINGKIPAAANFANRAITIDYTHAGALEVMAMCLIEKKKFPQAKLLAGAINDKSPGNPAVLRILDACRDAA